MLSTSPSKTDKEMNLRNSSKAKQFWFPLFITFVKFVNKFFVIQNDFTTNFRPTDNTCM